MISAGFDPEFIRWGCTIKDFKAYLLSVMMDRMERQREQSMALSLAVASLFDPKVGKEASLAIQRAIDAIIAQQEGLYGLQEMAGGGPASRPPTREEHRAQENQKDDSGITKKEVKVWQNAGKIDALMAKMTGKGTGAIWSDITDGNVTQDGNALSDKAGSVTGAQIVSKMQHIQQEMRNHVRAGPRRPRKK